ncbi:MFS transporter [Halioxenophilus sp. WMMB6]|uniref:MFS transporter n=1 Tax=Halioxenophilus sp. WMMB6 TaxID=3073815 RepID=UPI00295F2129|nr:MFS transporter [Halioxenophilus sp. WMMB6]
MAATPSTAKRRLDRRLRSTLQHSQKEAVASALMTATGDNFFSAFAIHLQASALQLSSLTAIPQFVGAFVQVASLSAAHFVERKKLVVVTALVQALAVLLLALLSAAAWLGLPAIRWLIVLVIVYHACLNIIQPYWRAWMGSLVPANRRGVFFAHRTRLTMATSFVMYLAGGGLLTLGQQFALAWAGFSFIFLAAAAGRGVSAYYFSRMHDPDPHPRMSEPAVISSTLAHCKEAIKDRSFRQYSLFVAFMQGMVAISAPFFAVYQLDELQFTYFQYAITSMASIVMQFFMLAIWGKVADRYGNRWVMMITSIILPGLPVLWLFSPNFYYLILVQLISGIGWSGFNLSTANYLYDIRPHRSNFAIYAALQSSTMAGFVFAGAMLGGWVATYRAEIANWLPFNLASTLFVVFILSSLLRSLVSLWFLPQIKEPHIRPRPEMLKIAYRIARFNAISGMVLDWLTVYRKPRDGDGDGDGDEE